MSKGFNMKICNICNKELDISMFYKETRTDTFRNYCKSCSSEAGKNRRRTKRGVIDSIYSNQKKASKRRGYPQPSYTKQDLDCWANSQELFHELYSRWEDSGYETKKKPSIDRIDDYKSYSMGNIQLMTWGNNDTKGNEDIKSGKNRKLSKAVNQLSMDGAIINSFHSANEASRVTGLNRSHICSCCRGNTKLKTTGGFKWEYSQTYLAQTK